MTSKTLTLCGMAAAALTVSGCNTLGEAAGLRKNVPDEFNVVTKAPLVVPPEYGLRPPSAGAEVPRELAAQRRGRNILFGQDLGQEASAGERALVASAGASTTDADIRTRVDFEEAEIIRKSGSFADQVLDFVPLTNSSTDADGNPLDADEEAARLRQIDQVNSATGGGQVVIERGSPGVKLPGT